MTSKQKEFFTVINEKGLHTRPSTELVKCASNFESEITLTYQDLSVDAKSLLGILMLAAAKGAEVLVEANGSDAKEATAAILDLAKQKFYINY